MAWESNNTSMSAEYKRNRPLVLERDGWKCRLKYKDICLVDGDQVDHKKNRLDGGDDSMENLQTVCDRCHKRKTHFESRRRIAKRKKDAVHPWTRLKNPGFL